MKELSLKEFYSQTLELKAPSKVVNLRIDGETRQVRLLVDLHVAPETLILERAPKGLWSFL
jgi:hypothetical protein